MPSRHIPASARAKRAIGKYNGKFMCNQFILRRGTSTTPIGHMRPRWRNVFYSRQRRQMISLRPAGSA